VRGRGSCGDSPGVELSGTELSGVEWNGGE
jgi:hypothetical protein